LFDIDFGIANDTSAAPYCGARFCVIDQNVSHKFRGNTIEVRAVGERWRSGAQPHKRFVDERGRLQSMTAAFVTHVAGCETVQLSVHERSEFFQSLAIALLPAIEELANAFAI
jgi:hypothetical protein